ncbi:Dipeptidase 1 [Trachymyrmex zeteki]|uniref:Dipeptidase n=1 Tax=Mycetomoellerius zeteki TaxID=64791 RepID=A0A151X8F8_9HYME|nr:Dipeptidase 1 [Trachymyrmex zeteki]
MSFAAVNTFTSFLVPLTRHKKESTMAFTSGFPTTCLTELPDVAPCNGTVRLPPPCEDSPSSGSSKDRRDESPRRRCRLLAPVLLLVVVLLLGGLCLPFLLQSAPATHQQRLDVIRRILTEVPLIDGHNDLPWNVRKFVHNQLGEVNLSSDLGRVDPWARSDWSHTDIPRLRAGLVGAQDINGPLGTFHDRGKPISIWINDDAIISKALGRAIHLGRGCWRQSWR